MPSAEQTTSDFKGDHLSSKMFAASGLTRTAFDCHMVSGSSAFTATLHLTAADIGKILIIQGAGVSGVPLVTTLLSVTDSTHGHAATTASTTVTGSSVNVGINDTLGLLAMSIPLGGTGEGVQRLIPTGQYLVTPGDYLIPNPQSGVMEGQGSRFNTVLLSSDPTSTDPVLILGNGTFEPHSWVLRNLAIDANHGRSQGALYFNRTNLMVIRDVIIQSLGVDAIGMSSPPTPFLFGEMIFDHVGVYGEDGGVPAGSIGALFYATGNVTLVNSNFEQLDTGIVFIGSSQVKFTFTGGHMERIGGYGFILSNCQPLIDCDMGVGAVWMDNATVNGELNLTNTSGLWTQGGVVDNGFGNRIRKTSSRLFNGTKASYAAGCSFDGDEWLNVASISTDPTFLNGSTGWAATNGSVTVGNVSMPGVPGGRSLQVTASSANAYAEKTFTATANKDYLLQVGLMTASTGIYRIVVADSGGTVWDSGNFTYSYASGDFQAFRVIRKSIPVTSDTVFKVRIYAVTSGQVTTCSLLLISQSQIQMNGDYGTSGTGLSTSGSGPGFTLTQNTTTGSVYSTKVVTSKNRSFARAVVTVPDGVVASMGIGGDGNTPTAGPIIPLRSGVTAEYTVPLSSYPDASIVQFYSFVSGGTIDIQELGVYAVDDAQYAPFVIQRPYTQLPNALALTDGRLWLGQNFNSNWQAPASAANGFKRALFGDNIYWDEDSTSFVIPNNGAGDWAALILQNSGDIALASEQGLTLPTTRTNTQVDAATRFRVIASTGTIHISPPGLGPAHVVVSNGSPEGVVAAPIGSICLNLGGGIGTALYVKESGSGNTGWTAQSTVFTVASAGIATTAYSIGIQKVPSTWTLEVAGYIQTDYSLVASGLSASRPVVTDGSKILISAKIELDNGNMIDKILGVANGGTGASTASGARTNLDVYSKAEVDANFAAHPHAHTWSGSIGDHSHGGVTTGSGATGAAGSGSFGGVTGDDS